MSSTSLTSSFSKPILVHATGSNFDAPISCLEGAVSVIDFDELMEKDWSVLDYDKFSPKEEFNRNIGRIISAGKIEEASRVLVSISSEEFVDRLVDSSSPCRFLLVVHDSLLMLAGGRVVISHPRGREVLKKQRQEHPEVLVSDLPDKTALQRVAAAHLYNVAEFVDESGLYLSVLSRSAA